MDRCLKLFWVIFLTTFSLNLGHAQCDLVKLLHITGSQGLPIGLSVAFSEYEPSSNNIIIGARYHPVSGAYPPGTDFIKDVTGGNWFSVYAYDALLNSTIEKKSSFFDSDTLNHRAILGASFIGGNILLGTIAVNVQGRRFFSFTWLDDVLNKLPIPSMIFEPEIMYAFSTNDFVYSDLEQRLLLYIEDKSQPVPQWHLVKIDDQGKILKKSVALDDSYDLIANRGGISRVFDSLLYVRPYYLMNEQLEVLCAYAAPSLQTGHGAVWSGNKMYYGTQNGVPVTPSLEQFTTAIVEASINCGFRDLFEQNAGQGGSNDVAVSGEAVAYADSNNIYLVDQRDGGFWLAPTNKVFLSSVRSSGILNWSLACEINKSLLPIATYSLRDETVFLLVQAVDIQTNAFDIYAVRLDQQGVLVNTQNTQLPAQSAYATLTNNLAKDQVYLQYKLRNKNSNGKLRMFDSQGVEVFRGGLDMEYGNKTFDISHLPNGFYFWSLTDGAGVVGSGKVVKM
jgi:hypothetical protein